MKVLINEYIYQPDAVGIYTEFLPILYNGDLDVNNVCKVDVGGEEGSFTR